MSKKLLVFLILSLWSLQVTVGQSSTVPNSPKNIRLLPENFKEDYQSNEYNYTESVSLITKFKIWLIEKLRSLFDVDSNTASDTFAGIKYLLYFVVIALAVYLLVKMIIGKEGRWLFKRNKNLDIDPDFATEENIQSLDFDKLIQRALINDDYRLAIKYQYFSLLKKLDNANIIKYDPQKTTYDYQLELEETKYNSIFNKAAYYYTYIWYGEFNIDANEYQTTSNVFTQLLKSTKDE